MKKFMLPLVTLFLLSSLLIGMVQAVDVTVTTVPDAIVTGGTTTITVTCDEAASGSITVITPAPSSTPYTKTITVPAGGSVSVDYPDDFSGASSSEVGEYTVIVFLSGSVQKFMASFYVYFNVHVIPELPIVGTVGATVAMLSGLGLFIVKKRRPK